MPIFSYFHPGHPCHMPPVNFGHQNLKCHQLVPGFWVLQNQNTSVIFHSDFVVWSTWGNKYHWSPIRARLVYAQVQKPRFYAHIQRKSAFLEGFDHFFGNWAIENILNLHYIYFHHSVGVAVGVWSCRNTGNAGLGIFEKIASMGKNWHFQLLGSRIHSKRRLLGLNPPVWNVPRAHLTPENFHDHPEKDKNFILGTGKFSPPIVIYRRRNRSVICRGYHLESQVRGRISLPKFFPRDSNFWDDFSTDFQDSKLKGSKFWYFDPHEQSYFPKNPKHVILNFTSEALIVGRSKWSWAHFEGK